LPVVGRKTGAETMGFKFLFWFLLPVLFATASAAPAQQTKKAPQVGYISASSAAVMLSRTAAFQQGLRELGYVDGTNIFTKFLYAEGKFDHKSRRGG
jgi:putative ABC transport system substrate-binding protein